MSKSQAQVVTLAGALLLGHWAQAAQAQSLSVSDPFASFTESLNSAAEKAIAIPVRLSMEGRESGSVSIATPIVPLAIKVSSPARAINRVQQLRPVIEPILHEEMVPTELAGIVLVESGGQPNALSPKGARGLWQFMPDTARRYGLIVSRARDERLDIQRSTRAAARYLRDLYGQFGDWQLAFAAYNAGGDLVQRAIERNHSSNFLLLSRVGSLPLETRRYVPAVIDAMQKVGNAGSFVAPPPNVGSWILYADTRMATDQPELLKEKKGELK
jgi:hypothetical protein